VVEEAAGGSDDEVDAIAEGAELAVHGSAAVDWGGVEAFEFGTEAVDFLTDLDGEFPGGAEDEDLWVELADVDAGEGRQGECSGFSRACGGEADEILALESGRNGEGLDG
jgi:hypothetical protein